MEYEDEEKVTYMGEADARNRRLKFGIKKKDRAKHLYAIGKTGMGKSTLLENLAIQDIQNGEGVCFLDPHGKSADLLMEYVPKHRIKDVIYFAPFDMEYPISFNVMEDVGPQQRYLVASGMMSAFKKIWVDAFSARMEYILGNIILALLEYPDSTLVGVNRMLTDKDFRKEVVNNISDPSVKAFWVNEYANYTEKFAAEATPAIQNKIGQFVANPLIRNIIGQPKTAFDIREVMDNKKILIINLSKGRVGEANANLLGSLLITKIYLGAMSRADLTEKQLEAAPNFYFYVDEFQSFANESFADILSEARKYKLNLHIAHQYIEQMTDEVRAAVFGNVGTMVAFRVGAYDAEVLEKEFAPYFTAEDIVNLQKYQMYLKLMIDGVTSKPFSATGLVPPPKSPINYTNEIIASSRAQYAFPRQKVEDELLAWIEKKFGSSGGSGGSSGGGAGGAGGQGGGGRDGQWGQGGRDGYKGAGKGQGSGNSGGTGGFGTRSSSQGSFTRSGSQSAPGGQRGPSGGQQGGVPSGVGNGGNRPPRGSNFNQSPAQSVPRRDSLQHDQPRHTHDDRSEKPVEKKVTEHIRPIPVSEAPAQEARQAMSLSHLKAEPSAPKEKTPKPENVAALREALLSMMKTTAPQAAGRSDSAGKTEAVQKSHPSSHSNLHSHDQGSHKNPAQHAAPRQEPKKYEGGAELGNKAFDAAPAAPSRPAPVESVDKNQNKQASSGPKEVEEDMLKNIFAD